MTPKQRAMSRFNYYNDPKSAAKHDQMADLISKEEDHWPIALEMSLYGKAAVWINSQGKCLLFDQDMLVVKLPKTSMGPTKVYLMMPNGKKKEIQDCDRNMMELVMVGNTDYERAVCGFTELRNLLGVQNDRKWNF